MCSVGEIKCDINRGEYVSQYPSIENDPIPPYVSVKAQKLPAGVRQLTDRVQSPDGEPFGVSQAGEGQIPKSSHLVGEGQASTSSGPNLQITAKQ